MLLILLNLEAFLYPFNKSVMKGACEYVTGVVSMSPELAFYTFLLYLEFLERKAKMFF